MSDEPERNPEHDEHVIDGLGYMMAGLMAKHLAARVDDAKIAAFSGHAITRTWTDEQGGLTSERIDPEDFYAKPEDE